MEIEDKTWFYVCCILCRALQGFALFGIQFSTLVTISSDYKKYLNTLTGWVYTIFGLGCAFGPFYSGIVVQYLGIRYVFFILCAASVPIVLCATCLLKPKSDEKEKQPEEHDDHKKKISFKSTIKMVELLIPLAGKILVNQAITFIEISISNFIMQQFGYSIGIAGSIMMLGPLIFTFGSSVTGIYIDKYGHSGVLFILGLVFFTLGSLLLGPAPFLHIHTKLAYVLSSLILHGFAASFVICSTTDIFFGMLRINKIEDSVESSAFANSCMIFSTNFGALIGPLIGGFLIDYLGFATAALQGAVISIIILLFYVAYLLFMRRCFCQRKRRGYESMESIRK